MNDHDAAGADNRLLAGRYALDAVIGRGGMANVWRATDRLLDRAVAIKVLRQGPELEADRRRFASEVRLLAGLNHPGLVTVLDAGTTQRDLPYLVMELVEGPTLGRVMAGGPLASARVASIGAPLASALAYAHGQGVVHRDVKPGNVLVDPSGRVRLADFGIARVIGDTVRHTQTGQAIGTAAYLSPEQVRGDDVTGASDVYSLGLVLLEALSGERAFPGTPTESAIARLSRSPEIPASFTPAWRRLLRTMTASDHQDRPSAADVATELALGETESLTAAELPAGPTSPVSVTAVRSVATSPAVGRDSPAYRRGGLAAAALLLMIGFVVLATRVGDASIPPAGPTRPAGSTQPAGSTSEAPSTPAPTSPSVPIATPVVASEKAATTAPSVPADDAKVPPGQVKKAKKAGKPARSGKAPKGEKSDKGPKKP